MHVESRKAGRDQNKREQEDEDLTGSRSHPVTQGTPPPRSLRTRLLRPSGPHPTQGSAPGPPTHADQHAPLTGPPGGPRGSGSHGRGKGRMPEEDGGRSGGEAKLEPSPCGGSVVMRPAWPRGPREGPLPAQGAFPRGKETDTKQAAAQARTSDSPCGTHRATASPRLPDPAGKGSPQLERAPGGPCYGQLCSRRLASRLRKTFPQAARGPQPRHPEPIWGE